MTGPAGNELIVNSSPRIDAYEPKTGPLLWQERIPGIFSASPVAADGEVYLTSETGEVIVLRVGREARSPTGRSSSAPTGTWSR